jgi:hypothetical protein
MHCVALNVYVEELPDTNAAVAVAEGQMVQTVPFR